MHRFDYQFLKNSVPGEIIGTAMVIADLRAKEDIRKLQNVDTVEALRRQAVIDSVRESNAIEGIVTTEERIRAIVGGTAPGSHDEYEISGYKDALNLIHTEHDQLDVTEQLILDLHRMLMAETRPEQAGKYKKTNNIIQEIDPDGNRRVRFSPIPAADVEKVMEQLLLAYYDARQDEKISPILLIPCVILDFLCIHPFTDGNGRVSRLLNLLMLYLAGYDIGRYIAIEGQISKYKDAYYQALADSSTRWHDNENNYMPFAIFSMQILYRCYREFDDYFMDISLKKAGKSERIEAVLMNSVVPISKSDICKKLPDVSVRTIEASLQKLQKEGKIRKVGANKNARYIRV